MCRVSNRKCVRFVSSISLKSMQRIKGTLRLRAYNESLLQQIDNSDHQFLVFAVLPLITAVLICMFCV